MSMSALMNSADCGPINPLQGLSKQLDRDRGVQQDHFGSSSQAGPSRSGFRTVSSASPQASQLRQEADQFFSRAQSPAFALPNAQPFNPASLAGPSRPQYVQPASSNRSLESKSQWQMSGPNSKLQPAPMNVALQDPALARATADWTSDFSLASQQSSRSATPPVSQGMAQTIGYSPSFAPMNYGAQFAQPPMWGAMNPVHQSPLASTTTATPNQISSAPPDWAAQFESIEKATFAEPQPVTAPVEPSSSTVTVDDLAATAGLLVSSVQHDTNPKFQNSEFMNLMRRLRDREAVVDGNEIVSSSSQPITASGDWASEMHAQEQSRTTGMDKGKGRAVDDVSTSSLPAGQQTYNVAPGFYDSVASHGINPGLYREALAREMGPSFTSSNPQLSASAPQNTDSLAQSFDQLGLDEEEASDMLGKDYLLSQTRTGMGDMAERYAEMGRMQAEWDELDSAIDAESRTKLEEVEKSGYTFQERNPYMQEGRMMGIEVQNQALPYQSVLQTEAAVQQSPNSASAWFSLGIKQQENEREDKAILALLRALELDPSHSAALLALAVSYTNENSRLKALESVERWIDIQATGDGNGSVKYADAVRAHRTLNARMADEDKDEIEMLTAMGISLKQRDLVECLMTMARMSPDGQIDADIQIALGVLLNSSEEYDKARDCFQTALAVRPEDHVLYNRVGATLANSGKAQDALGYYYRALELNPSYIRARFNLGISCVNLKMYHDAAQHILDALVLQDIDSSAEGMGAVDGSSSSGISSSALWDSLRSTCLHMQRHDLVTLCEKRDLTSFREAFAVSSRTHEMYEH